MTKKRTKHNLPETIYKNGYEDEEIKTFVHNVDEMDAVRLVKRL